MSHGGLLAAEPLLLQNAWPDRIDGMPCAEQFGILQVSLRTLDIAPARTFLTLALPRAFADKLRIPNVAQV